MTLIIALIRPEGIWLSSDNRVTRSGHLEDDDTPKQMYIICLPWDGGPRVLLAFTGLAEIYDGASMLEWIRETTRGETRPAMEMFNHARD